MNGALSKGLRAPVDSMLAGNREFIERARKGRKLMGGGRDCLIVDESHRLVKQMYGDFQGENQIKECIQASLFMVFFIDESRRITTKDIGSIEGIRYWASQLNSRVIMNENTKLVLKAKKAGENFFQNHVSCRKNHVSCNGRF